MKKSVLRAVLVLVITIGIFYAIFAKIDFWAVVNVLSTSDPFWLAIAFFLSLFSIAVEARRWQVLLKSIEYNLQYKDSFNLVMGALPLTSITPSKAGDVIKAYYLKDKIPASKTIGTVITERTFDVLSLVLLSLIGAIFCKKYELIGIVVFVIICIITALFIVRKGFNLPIRESWNEKLKNLIYSMERVTTKKRDFIAIMSYSLLIWFLSIVQVLALFHSLSIDVPLSFTIANLPIAIFVGLIPVTFGGMGTRDAAIVFLFSHYAEQSRLFGAAILLSIFRYWLLSLIGIPFLISSSRRPPNLLGG